MNKSFHNFSAKNLQGEEVGMESFKGKTVLVVNTASKCGLAPQLEGLENLYQKYKDKNLVVLGFPCNQFANQEPGDAESIKQECMINYGVSFPMFSKIDVNGPTAHEIYKYLKQKQGGLFGDGIKWNFTKFLINKDGIPVKRFAPYTKPEKIERYIKPHLG